MTEKRKCKNWLSTYLEYTLNRLESPESYLLFSGLFALSSVLRRKVYIPRSYLGGYECYPHLYAVLVGPAGIVRKTTAMNQSIDLLEQVGGLVKGPNIVTQAALLQKIVESDDNAVYVMSTELSDLIMKSGPEMYQFLTSMFDGHKSFESTTIGRGVEFAERPCVNLFAATTPEWISGNMPEEVIGGGFASRCIFIYEDTPRFKRLLYNKIHYPNSIISMEKDLVEDLKYISNSLSGEFSISDEAADFLDDGKGGGWYGSLHIIRGSKIASYMARKHIHVFKLAMLLHVAYSDELVLTLADFKDAISILDNLEPKMLNVFSGVGKNRYTLNTKSIVEFVANAEGKRVRRDTLLRAFEATAEPMMLDQLLNGLIAAGYLRAISEGDVIYFQLAKEI